MKINITIDLSEIYVYEEGENLEEIIRKELRDRIQREITDTIYEDKEVRKIISLVGTKAIHYINLLAEEIKIKGG